MERGMFVAADEERTRGEQLAFPLRMSDFRFEVQRPAPDHGEHSREILSELGYDEEHIGGLAKQGVI
jgi:crotonobetainyl-CoA:carnitine CoA-transferase CaiB-like acyl-CoA transferase